MRVAGDELDEAIVNYVKRAYNLMIGERTAEEIKIKIGSAFPPENAEKETSMEIKGRDLVAGPAQDADHHQPGGARGVGGADQHHRRERAHHAGALPAGAGERTSWTAAWCWRAAGRSCAGWINLLMQETGLPVHVAEDPLSAVAEGTGKVL